jgi:multisubunit Na+/H+ antiporter MnhE subunit
MERRTVLVFCGWWAVLAGFWLVLADKSEFPELCAAVVAGAVGAAAAVAARAEQDVVARPRARRVARLIRPVKRVPHDLWLLLRALAQAAAGHAPAGERYEVPFDTADDARGAARQVLAAIGGTLPPNTVVAGFDDERRTMVVHRLVAGGDRERDADPMELRGDT